MYPLRQVGAVLALWAALPTLAGSVAQAQQVVTRSTLTVSYRDPQDARQLPLVFRTWDKAAADLRALGLTLPKAHLTAALNAAQFASVTGEPASIAASTRGRTVYTQRLTALAGRGLLADTIRHEAFHVAQPPGLARWKAEGLARVFSGEARRDPAGATGLETLSGSQLDQRLLGRVPGETGRAYAEASRRARELVRTLGWKAALDHQ